MKSISNKDFGVLIKHLPVIIENTREADRRTQESARMVKLLINKFSKNGTDK